jgi:dynein assembly factor 1
MKKKAAELEKDVNGHVVMSLKNLEKCCEEEGLYATPELNDKLYLHFKGFHKIDNLLRFTELKALWLNNNAITTIENLSYCRQMVTLYLNNNIIKKIEGLDNLELLCILNLSHNRIERIEGLASLRKLNSLAISHNLLTTAESLEGIGECPSVANLDLSNNEIECQEEVLTLLSQLPELAVLYLKNTPLARGFKNYRKRFVSSLEKLKFLDERPVNSSERRLS